MVYLCTGNVTASTDHVSASVNYYYWLCYGFEGPCLGYNAVMEYIKYMDTNYLPRFTYSMLNWLLCISQECRYLMVDLKMTGLHLRCGLYIIILMLIDKSNGTKVGIPLLNVFTGGLTYTQCPPPSIHIPYPNDPSKTRKKHLRMHFTMFNYVFPKIL